ncbi:predicted protein [Meyerozyma guilliermondii ATCC 6260]|uniref:Uncharacterized protein n=1 Tax=Meyerozyma guilliermondii (strain ATCC 6260 / CBS 566 / DSM 6381 / JCM 1539 / NBRC 10279 / NRRL Y-324) TaxID=294746 RepID=A5DHM9_PICGU|nr:uncharacterized protein PGUG_02780 [Meyerozyma guilliermondii ATCC 6260]EDK38682.2 predicted protein [Meyerozyma guilliermondii ATCC 6260]
MPTPQVQEMTPPQADVVQDLITQLRGMPRQQREWVWSEVTRRQRETRATAPGTISETSDRRSKNYEMYAVLLVIFIILLVYVIVAVVKDFTSEDYFLHFLVVVAVIVGLDELNTFLWNCQVFSIWEILGVFIRTLCLAASGFFAAHYYSQSTESN